MPIWPPLTDGLDLLWHRWLLGYGVLNRKTLKLSFGDPSESAPKGHYMCEVFESFGDYHDKLLEIQPEKQIQLEEEMQDNKI